jgi:hypothetical protein
MTEIYPEQGPNFPIHEKLALYFKKIKSATAPFELAL